MRGTNEDNKADTPASQHGFNVPPEIEPAIYAASLADYNVGDLHGRWVSAAQEPEQMQAQIDEMLAASEQPIAEEWAIHDYQGFGSLALHEYERLEVVADIGLGIALHGLAYTAWAQIIGTNKLSDHDFVEHYRGYWPSLEDYAEHYLEDIGIDPEQLLDSDHAWLNRYLKIDYNQLAHDLAHDLEITQDTKPGGGIHIFDPPE